MIKPICCRCGERILAGEVYQLMTINNSSFAHKDIAICDKRKKERSIKMARDEVTWVIYDMQIPRDVKCSTCRHLWLTREVYQGNEELATSTVGYCDKSEHKMVYNEEHPEYRVLSCNKFDSFK